MLVHRKGVFVCIAGSILVLLFSICFMKNAGENIISDLIIAGQLDKKYLSSEGWYFDYSGIDAHCIATGIFITLFYVLQLFWKSNKLLAIFTLGLYLIAELVIVINFVHFALLIGIPVLFVFSLAVVSFKYCE